jgi:RNA methyltransferase, TrmH family
LARRPLITSASNDRLKSLRRLRSRGHGRAAGLFVADGFRQLRCALEAGATVREVYAAPELYLGASDAALVTLAERRGAHVVELGADAFTSVAGRARPDGLLAVVERWPTGLGAQRFGREPLLVVADSVERPGNLGTIVRTACGAGATGLVACDLRMDLFHPDTVAGSVGALFHLPVADTTSAEAIAWLRRLGARIVVASPDAGAPYWRADYRGAVAIVLGSERHGVGEPWLEVADAGVAIPMTGAVDSLNVAVAAGIVVFEAARQRRESGARVSAAQVDERRRVPAELR